MGKYDNWIGLGAKGGGTLGILGMEYLGGTLRNVGSITEHHDFQLLSYRMGVGLGGGVGVTACIVYDCGNLIDLNGTRVEDWSVNAQLGAKWDSILKGLKNYKFLVTVAKLGKKILNATPGDMDNLRNAMSYLYTAYDIASKGKGPKVVTIDIPGAGVGLELSLHRTEGNMEILD